MGKRAQTLRQKNVVFETGVLRVQFKLRTSEASVSQTRHSNVLVLLLSCAPGPPTPLSTLVRDRFC